MSKVNNKDNRTTSLTKDLIIEVKGTLAKHIAHFEEEEEESFWMAQNHEKLKVVSCTTEVEEEKTCETIKADISYCKMSITGANEISIDAMKIWKQL